MVEETQLNSTSNVYEYVCITAVYISPELLFFFLRYFEVF